MSVISPINTNSSQTSNSFSVAASSASASAPSSSSSSDSSQPAATWVANIPSAGIASALQSLHSFQLVDDQRYLTICFRLRAEKLEWFQAIQQQQAAHRSRASSLSTPQLYENHGVVLVLDHSCNACVKEDGISNFCCFCCCFCFSEFVAPRIMIMKKVKFSVTS
jgi:hypothetical protein